MEWLKKIIRPYRINYIRRKNRQRFEREIKRGGELKIVVGSSGKFIDGWIPTERYFLNLLEESDWYGYFKENTINNILAEHVWEHLTLDEGARAAKVCYKFLKNSGKLRIAVPDGFNPNKEYIDYVKVNGSGRGSDDHKVLYDCKKLGKILKEAGFLVHFLEFHDENGVFKSEEWNLEEGHIYRRVGSNEVFKDNVPNYTSLIVDAIKQ